MLSSALVGGNPESFTGAHPYMYGSNTEELLWTFRTSAWKFPSSNKDKVPSCYAITRGAFHNMNLLKSRNGYEITFIINSSNEITYLSPKLKCCIVEVWDGLIISSDILQGSDYSPMKRCKFIGVSKSGHEYFPSYICHESLRHGTLFPR